MQRRQQAELRDLDSRLRQFLVVDPRYDSSGAPQALTRAGQVKKCFGVSPFRLLSSHIRCIYIYTDFVKSPINGTSSLFHDGESTMHMTGSRRNSVREATSDRASAW